MAEDRRFFSRRWPYLTTLYNTSSSAWKNYFDIDNYIPRFSPRPHTGLDETFDTCDGSYRPCHFDNVSNKKERFSPRSVFPVSRSYSCDGRSCKTGSVLSDRVFTQTRSRVICLAIFIIFSLIAAVIGAVTIAVHISTQVSASQNTLNLRRCESFYSRVELNETSPNNCTKKSIASKFAKQMEYLYGNSSALGFKLCNATSTSVQQTGEKQYTVWFRVGYRPDVNQNFRTAAVSSRLLTLLHPVLNTNVLKGFTLSDIEPFKHESSAAMRLYFQKTSSGNMTLNETSLNVVLNPSMINVVSQPPIDDVSSVKEPEVGKVLASPTASDIWRKPPSWENTLGDGRRLETEFQDDLRLRSHQNGGQRVTSNAPSHGLLQTANNANLVSHDRGVVVPDDIALDNPNSRPVYTVNVRPTSQMMSDNRNTLMPSNTHYNIYSNAEQARTGTVYPKSTPRQNTREDFSPNQVNSFTTVTSRTNQEIGYPYLPFSQMKNPAQPNAESIAPPHELERPTDVNQRPSTVRQPERAAGKSNDATSPAHIIQQNIQGFSKTYILPNQARRQQQDVRRQLSPAQEQRRYEQLQQQPSRDQQSVQINRQLPEQHRFTHSQQNQDRYQDRSQPPGQPELPDVRQLDAPSQSRPLPANVPSRTQQSLNLSRQQVQTEQLRAEQVATSSRQQEIELDRQRQIRWQHQQEQERHYQWQQEQQQKNKQKKNQIEGQKLDQLRSLRRQGQDSKMPDIQQRTLDLQRQSNSISRSSSPLPQHEPSNQRNHLNSRYSLQQDQQLNQQRTEAELPHQLLNQKPISKLDQDQVKSQRELHNFQQQSGQQRVPANEQNLRMPARDSTLEGSGNRFLNRSESGINNQQRRPEPRPNSRYTLEIIDRLSNRLSQNANTRYLGAHDRNQGQLSGNNAISQTGQFPQSNRQSSQITQHQDRLQYEVEPSGQQNIPRSRQQMRAPENQIEPIRQINRPQIQPSQNQAQQQNFNPIQPQPDQVGSVNSPQRNSYYEPANQVIQRQQYEAALRQRNSGINQPSSLDAMRLSDSTVIDAPLAHMQESSNMGSAQPFTSADIQLVKKQSDLVSKLHGISPGVLPNNSASGSINSINQKSQVYSEMIPNNLRTISIKGGTIPFPTDRAALSANVPRNTPGFNKHYDTILPYDLVPKLQIINGVLAKEPEPILTPEPAISHRVNESPPIPEYNTALGNTDIQAEIKTFQPVNNNPDVSPIESRPIQEPTLARLPDSLVPELPQTPSIDAGVINELQRILSISDPQTIINLINSGDIGHDILHSLQASQNLPTQASLAEVTNNNLQNSQLNSQIIDATSINYKSADTLSNAGQVSEQSPNSQTVVANTVQNESDRVRTPLVDPNNMPNNILLNDVSFDHMLSKIDQALYNMAPSHPQNNHQDVSSNTRLQESGIPRIPEPPNILNAIIGESNANNPPVNAKNVQIDFAVDATLNDILNNNTNIDIGALEFVVDHLAFQTKDLTVLNTTKGDTGPPAPSNVNRRLKRQVIVRNQPYTMRPQNSAIQDVARPTRVIQAKAHNVKQSLLNNIPQDSLISQVDISRRQQPLSPFGFRRLTDAATSPLPQSSQPQTPNSFPTINRNIPPLPRNSLISQMNEFQNIGTGIGNAGSNMRNLPKQGLSGGIGQPKKVILPQATLFKTRQLEPLTTHKNIFPTFTAGSPKQNMITSSTVSRLPLELQKFNVGELAPRPGRLHLLNQLNMPPIPPPDPSDKISRLARIQKQLGMLHKRISDQIIKNEMFLSTQPEPSPTRELQLPKIAHRPVTQFQTRTPGSPQAFPVITNPSTVSNILSQRTGPVASIQSAPMVPKQTRDKTLATLPFTPVSRLGSSRLTTFNQLPQQPTQQLLINQQTDRSDQLAKMRQQIIDQQKLLRKQQQLIQQQSSQQPTTQQVLTQQQPQTTKAQVLPLQQLSSQQQKQRDLHQKILKLLQQLDSSNIQPAASSIPPVTPYLNRVTKVTIPANTQSASGIPFLPRSLIPNSLLTTTAISETMTPSKFRPTYSVQPLANNMNQASGISSQTDFNTVPLTTGNTPPYQTPNSISKLQLNINQILAKLGRLGQTPSMNIQSGLQNMGVSTQNTGLVPQNTGIVPQNTGLISHNTGLIPQNTGLIPQNTGLISHNTGLIPQNTGLISQNTGLVTQNTAQVPVAKQISSLAQLHPDLALKPQTGVRDLFSRIPNRPFHITTTPAPLTTTAWLVSGTTFASSLDFPWYAFVPGVDPLHPTGNMPPDTYYDVPPIF